ncbi:12307_t:CDS:2 [Racocetra fulgida]|uniref:12307_t:CDS:1 n=1 Tax=Racocetra fulgida TaxID=60492 RepID=A0A9N9EGP2_9GLOM|nr:12307_t:CDS:2 [Racocetra fulgida]
MEKKKKNITFYALDLMENELNKSLSSLGTFSHVKLVGLCGTYEDGMDFIATLPDNKQKTFMWLGSSIGDLSRENGAKFIHLFQEKVMNPGDLFLIGIDRRNNREKIAAAYDDPQGINAEFAMNALDHLNVIFDQPFINRNNFDYFSTYNEDEGRREGYYRSKKDQIFEFIVSNDINKEKIKINVKVNELILIAYSYKYNKTETTKLFYDAHLAHVEKIWKSWDAISLSMIPLDKMYSKPIYLRHPLIFYLGHIPSFLDIKLATYSHEKFTETENFANIFEREINHDMDDLSKCNPHSAVPDQWPKLSLVLEYQDKVRQRLLRIYDAYKDKQIPRSLDLPFGWDNELPSRKITVESFKIQSRPITNNEYLEFMKVTVNQNYPLSWIPIDLSSFEYRVRTVFGPVDMTVAMNWHVLLSFEQASHYAEWAKMRLPTEGELRCFYDTYSRNLNLDSNFGFAYWHPTDVPLDNNSVHNIVVRGHGLLPNLRNTLGSLKVNYIPEILLISLMENIM